VRLVASDGSQVGVVSLEVALETAQKETLDLVEISPDAEPPVCKVMDYGKHVFDIKKKVALQKKKQKQTQVKEMKFRPGTDQGDYDIKFVIWFGFWKMVIKPKSLCGFVDVKWLTKSLVWK